MEAEPGHRMVAELLHESMRNGQTPFLTITSNSMAPLLMRDDQVGLRETEPGAINPGDIIVVDAGAVFVTHRFWRRESAYLITKGDRSLAFDPPWLESALVGLVVTRRRGRLLSLCTGRGAWVSRRLWQLARLEQRLIGSFGPAGPTASPDDVPPDRSGRYQSRRYGPAWLLRRAFYAGSKILTVMVTHDRRKAELTGDKRAEKVGAEI